MEPLLRAHLLSFLHVLERALGALPCCTHSTLAFLEQRYLLLKRLFLIHAASFEKLPYAGKRHPAGTPEKDLLQPRCISLRIDAVAILLPLRHEEPPFVVEPKRTHAHASKRAKLLYRIAMCAHGRFLSL